VAALSGAALADPPPSYRARFVTPGISANNAAAMNQAGDIVGTANSGSGGWVSRGGAPAVPLPLPAGTTFAIAYDISDNGVIVGSAGNSQYSWMGRAVAWFPDGAGGYTIQQLGTLPGHVNSAATAVNNLGDIVGWSFTGMYRLPVLFTAPGGIQDLSATGIFDPVDINDHRVLIDHSFTCKRLDLNTMLVEDLGVPAGPPSYLASSGAAINERGQVAGLGIYACCDNCDRVAARFTDEVGWEVFSICGQSNGAYDLNDLGDMVMRLNVAPYARFEGVGTFRIEDLIVNDVGHWYVTNGYGLTINNARQMAVPAHNDVTGQAGIVLLTPIIEGDVNADGQVDADDLVAVILAWGACPAPPAPCPADINTSGAVDADDLVMVILNWS
jgi:hypothetical protein